MDQIFESYHFKDLTKASKPKPILKNMYNAYFGKNIISSIKDKTTNYKLSIKDETRMLYWFSVDNLEIRNQSNNDFSGVDMFNDEDLPEIKEKEEVQEVKPNKSLTKIFIDFND